MERVYDLNGFAELREKTLELVSLVDRFKTSTDNNVGGEVLSSENTKVLNIDENMECSNNLFSKCKTIRAINTTDHERDNKLVEFEKLNSDTRIAIVEIDSLGVSNEFNDHNERDIVGRVDEYSLLLMNTSNPELNDNFSETTTAIRNKTVNCESSAEIGRSEGGGATHSFSEDGKTCFIHIDDDNSGRDINIILT